jgi:Holliday junction DNA helicase RuvA
MIAHLQGKLVEKSPTQIIIDCGGVGYSCKYFYTRSLLPNTDFIYASSKRMRIHGFMEKSEQTLLSVSGIGANIARTMLSSLDPKQITNAIASADVVTIQSIKGIGSKTAQRVILDLKESVEIV